MILLLFSLLTVVGGWVAWRLNPMYSAGKTLQVVVLFGGSIAIVMAALITLADINPRDPRAVYIIADIITFLAGFALTLSGGMRVFNPPPAPLPPGTKLVTVNRRRIIPWLKALAGILLVLGVV